MSKRDSQVAPNLNQGLSIDELFMSRCIQLAKLGAGYVAPNPMVGAVLVYRDRIIGEGFHQRFGQAHAEVHCIESVAADDIALIPKSKLYVSLEPCIHHGKTPPCADLIIRHGIPEVIIGCRDPFPEVNGKGIEKLKAAGINVKVGILEKNCQDLNRRFFHFHTYKRPYLILKWAQSADGFLARSNHSRTFISNEFTNSLVHQWRSEESAILVGTNTALYDDPELTVRKWTGPDPTRLVIDRTLRLPDTLKLFNRQTKTVVFNYSRDEEFPNLRYYRISTGDNFLVELIGALYQLEIQSVLVEGGAKILKTLIDTGIWDEARVITNEKLFLGEGIPAPGVKSGSIFWEGRLFSDNIVAMKKIQ